jgi:tetratricopeptide (TPR) repeat protein
MTRKENGEPGNDPLSSKEKIRALISERRYDEAKSLIVAEGKRLPARAHRLMALSARLHEEVGEIEKSIALMRQAIRQKPAWLPYLYQLSVILMDAEYWSDADIVLKEIIALSLANSDAYFLDESRFRRAVCLKKLGCSEEFNRAKAEIPTGTKIFLRDRSCGIEDIA